MPKKSFIFLFFIVVKVLAQEPIQLKTKDSISLKLAKLEIDVSIVGNFARTTYDMQFYNGLDRTLEGELEFPLGEGQAVSHFAMEVNGTLRNAVVVEKELARVAFESTVRQNIDPAFLEKTEGNNYKARVYPILPKKYKRIVLSFEQELATFDQNHIYELPLGLKDSLDFFSIKIEVYKSQDMPKVINSIYKNFFFKEKNGFFLADTQLVNHKPKNPVVIEIPSFNNSSSLMTYRDYFHITDKIKTKSRLKPKPKRITLLWDASYSQKSRKLKSELEVLGAYLEYLRDVEIEFISFSNSILERTIVRIKNGDWEQLKNTIEKITYDGGTSFNVLGRHSKSDEILLFSDGLSNLGNFPKIYKKAVYTINSSISANHELLESIATASGGSYVNMVNMPYKEAVKALKSETFQYLGVVSNKAVFELYPKTRTNVHENFSVSGRFRKNTELELLFGYQGKITERVKVPIQKSQNNQLVRRLWAKQKLNYLNLDKKENKEHIISHGKEYHLITDYTSMLILDRIEDYVRYRIEPPNELKGEYKDLIGNLEEEEAEKSEALKFRKESLLDEYRVVQDWYNTNYPIKKTKSPKKDSSVHSTLPRSVNNPNDSNLSGETRPLTNNTISTRNTVTVDSTRGIVSGTVLDADSRPLPGVNVIVKGSDNGTTTDFDGNFLINAESEDELTFSYIGFKPASFVISETNRISIVLEESSQALEEVVVTSMGIQRERKAVGYSISTVVSESLQGNVAGIQITQNSGDISSKNAVKQSGNSSITGENGPLYVVDGVPVMGNPIQELKPEDINGIQVLKAMHAIVLYGNRASNGVVIITTKNGSEVKQEKIEELNRRISDKIELKSWNPETPYIQILEQQESIELAYKKYLDIRNDYSNSPSFYLDVSDFFDQRGSTDYAITILTNLMEVELNNHELLKALAYKLEYFEEYELASIVYEKVLELRPEEPQSYRDLALVYEQLGKIKESFDLLYLLYEGQLLVKDEDERFNGIEQIAYIELSRLVNKYSKRLKLRKEIKNKFKEIPVDIRIVIDWNHNDTDIDLWVIDPTKEKAYYKNNLTKIGGRISEDMTEGYGPEEFMLKNANKGEYRILADYYSDNIQKISGPTILKVSIFTDYGKSNEKKKIKILRLDKEEDELEVGSIKY
ncbi:VIT domain-containing protein [Sediminicola luteus]|uniref:VIT domain-containing protein n=1 Tax=Sediminicola luteus TaxID=319238 RepID=A0A2A4G3V3_9FLAO|nr:VIT domain-containing protein [Sediminicola luteus]PCE63103.1 hypothetical protein B7P33_17685 [Sediminicola luteus]